VARSALRPRYRAIDPSGPEKDGDDRADPDRNRGLRDGGLQGGPGGTMFDRADP
jgi:hypothetical protein